MKFLLQFILTAALGALLQTFLPFWVIAPVAFGAGMVFGRNDFVSFISGFLAIALLWGMAAFIIDTQTASILTGRIASIFSLSKGMLILVVAIIGGLLGGFGALSGSLFGTLFWKEKRNNLY